MKNIRRALEINMFDKFVTDFYADLGRNVPELAK